MTVAEGSGTVPAGPDGQSIRSMFTSIAPRYDLVNHVLSLSVDRYWRRRVVHQLARYRPVLGDRCLDLCAGTGDLAIDIHHQLKIETIGSDFCHSMLTRFRDKVGEEKIPIAESDAQQLPFADASFRFVTMAFGLRNIENRHRALCEAYRVLMPRGVLVILEFSRPVVPVLREGFQFYFRHVLPHLGTWISGTAGPYAYLPDSVRRFPNQKALVGEIASAGFERVAYQNLSFGVAALHWGVKAD